MLGMIIGTSSIIAVLGISRAASGGITGTLNSFGDQGSRSAVDPSQDDPQSAAIQYRDVRSIEADRGPLLAHVEPAYQRNMRMRAGRRDDDDVRGLRQRRITSDTLDDARGPPARPPMTSRAARTSAT